MKRIPIPAFLRRIDRYLLENHPLLWTVKLHYLLPVAGIMWLLLTAFLYLKPVTADAIPDVNKWGIILFLFSALVFSLFGVYRLILLPHRQLGSDGLRSAYGRFFLTLLGGICLLAIPIGGAGLVVDRMVSDLPEEEIVRDINAMNLGSVFFSQEFSYGSGQRDYRPFHSFEIHLPGQLGHEELEVRANRQESKEKLLLKLRNFEKAIHKWGGYTSFDEDKLIRDYQNAQSSRWDYELGSLGVVRDNLYQWGISQDIEQHLFDWNILGILLFIVFMGSLLFQVLQSVSLKHFLIASAMGILLFPATVFIVEMARNFSDYSHGPDEYFALLVSGYFLIGTVLMFLFTRSGKTANLGSIVTILINVTLPFMPVFMTISYQKFVASGFLLREAEDLPNLLWVGAAIYILIGIPLFHSLFRRLRTRPAG